ncbi:MAG: aminoglycoside phosphotransferase family protein, partial [Ktedonobacterales bacterium]|nr:aminoglycoside phosphotransferase family protein [Ktedonobacterales bacterium]
APPDTPNWLDWLEDADQSLRLRLAAGSQKENHRLLHCDYHPLNVLTDGNRITGVLDWTNALAGDPRADVARTVTILRLDSGPPSFAKSLLLWLFEGGWRRGYIQAGGTLPDMARFNLWAGMVMTEDLAAKRSPAHLARIHRWVARWRARLGWDA